MKKSNRKRKLKNLIILGLVLMIALIGALTATVMIRHFALVGDAEMSVELGEEFADPGVTSKFARADGEVDTNTQGDYTITYKLMNRTLTRTVHVVENSSRYLMGLRGSSVQLVKQGEPYAENGAFAFDTKSTGADFVVPESEITISGDVDTSKPGDYEVKYQIQKGNTTFELTRTVRVVAESEFGDAPNGVPVLMYHWVYSDDDRPNNLTANWILDTDFEEQLQYLKDNDYYYPGWAELRAWTDGEITLPKRSVMLTFNDGVKSFFEHGLPLLEKYEIPATVFLNCGENNDGQQKVEKYASKYLDFESQSYDMHRAGHVAGYRSVIAGMSKDEIKADLEQAQKVVGNNEAFAYPYGDYTTDATEAVKEQGVKVAFTTTYGRVYPGQNPYRLPRVRVTGDTGFKLWRESVSK